MRGDEELFLLGVVIGVWLCSIFRFYGLRVFFKGAWAGRTWVAWVSTVGVVPEAPSVVGLCYASIGGILRYIEGCLVFSFPIGDMVVGGGVKGGGASVLFPGPSTVPFTG